MEPSESVPPSLDPVSSDVVAVSKAVSFMRGNGSNVAWGYAQGGRKDLGFAIHHGEREGTGEDFVIENNNA